MPSRAAPIKRVKQRRQLLQRKALLLNMPSTPGAVAGNSLRGGFKPNRSNKASRPLVFTRVVGGTSRDGSTALRAPSSRLAVSLACGYDSFRKSMMALRVAASSMPAKGFIVLPGTAFSGLAMKPSSLASSQLKLPSIAAE